MLQQCTDGQSPRAMQDVLCKFCVGYSSYVIIVQATQSSTTQSLKELPAQECTAVCRSANAKGAGVQQQQQQHHKNVENSAGDQTQGRHPK
jgi:hypothetical protein